MMYRVVLLAAALLCAACARENAAPEAVTRTDSAGIEIVDNHTPAWASGQAWRVADLVASVGTADGDSSDVLWQVTGARLLPDGSFVILSGGARSARLYSPDGRFIRTIGRAGEGPGEFSYPTHVQVIAPDTIRIWDTSFEGVSTFLASGQFIDERQIDLGRMMDALGAGSGAENFTPLHDGSFVVHAQRRHAARPRGGEIARNDVQYVHIDRRYQAADLGWFQGMEVLYPSDPTNEPLLHPAFPANAVIVTGGDPERIYITNGDRSLVHVYSAEGALTRLIRRDGPGKPLPPETRDSAIDWFITRNTRTPQAAARVRQFTRNLPDQTHYPAISAMVVDDRGNLWTHDGAGDWSVYNPDGRWLGTLHVPLARILDIRDNLILGLHRTADDVDVIQVLRMISPGSESGHY